MQHDPLRLAVQPLPPRGHFPLRIGIMWKETLKVRLWAWMKVPMIAWLRPSIVEIDATRAAVRIPLFRRSRNHWGSMYFGALCAGADIAGGIIAMRTIERSGARVTLIFKDFSAEFLRRADGDVTFLCSDGEAIAALVRRAAETGERENMPVAIEARVQPSEEVVARFTLTLSLKRKD